MTRKSLTVDNEAVSEIVGELLVLFITVAVFGLLVTAVHGLISHPQTSIVTISAANNSSTVLLTHMGGDSIDYSRISVIVNANNVPYTRSDVNGNGLWELGEVLYAGNPPAGQGLDVLVYDSAAHVTLGDFRLR
jgi:FlaG/FlaF family flagellin (archaellin)